MYSADNNTCLTAFFCRTTWVSWHKKGKLLCILM